MAEKLGVGIIGVGSIATMCHIPGYQAIADRVEVRAVADVVEERAREVAAEFSVPRAFADYRQLLELPEIDLVSVCVPPFAHRDCAVDALGAGKHVLCEKPMAMNSAEAGEMIAAAESAGKKLSVQFQTRQTPQARLLKSKIEQGELGRIYFARAQYLRRRGIPSWGMFHSRAHNGGGALIDVGVHILDLTMWLMGSPKPVAAFGSTFDHLGRRGDIWNSFGPHNHAEFDVDDSAFACVKFDNGAIVNFECSWAANFQARAQQQLTIAGDRGGAQVFPLKLFGDDGDALYDIEPGPFEELDYKAQHRAAIDRFVDAVENDRPVLVEPQQARAVTQVIDAIYESTESGGLARIGP